MTGSDITRVAVTHLKARFPSDRFVELDISADLGDFGDEMRFDLISAMDVLFHIVDDVRFGNALENLSRLLEPGGLLIFSETFRHREVLRVPHVVSRSLEDIEHRLDEAGLSILRRKPMFFLMNEPVDSTSRTHDRWWTKLNATVSAHQSAGAWIGGMLFPVELALVTMVREGPGTEIMLCVRR